MENIKTSESKEISINNSKTDKKEKNSNKKKKKNLKDEVNNLPKKSNINTIFLVGIFIALLMILVIILFFIIKKKNDKKITVNNETKNQKIIENNYIDASYSVNQGKQISILNPDKIDLNDDDYYIEEINKKEVDRNNLRNLKILDIKNGLLIPDFSGILSVKINFKKNLNSLDNLFKNNNDLIKVNLTNLNMNEIKSMNSTFSGCSNLTEINFEGTNTKNLQKMENTFENCTNLKNLNLSPLNTSNLNNMTNIFSGCDKLETIDLSSFKNINNNIFNGISSQPKIISNNIISEDIIDLFKKLFNIQINVIIISDSKDNCEIGEKEKCKTCSNKIKSNCLQCNEGYYLPLHEMDNKFCLPCNIIYNCLSCYGEKNDVICLNCEFGYNLINNKCEKIEEKEISNCIIGSNEKCKTCNNNPGLKNKCGACNDGYYLSEDGNRTICDKCDIEGCSQCSGLKDNKICNLCQEGYIFNDNKCVKKEEYGTSETYIKNENLSCNTGYFLPPFDKCMSCNIINHCSSCFWDENEVICLNCEFGYNLINNKCEKIEEKEISNCIIGSNEKCKTCNNNPGLKNQCQTCNSGYYLPEDGNRTICDKCDIEGCSQCSGLKDNKLCNFCQEGYILSDNKCLKEEKCEIGENEKCSSCRTDIGHKKECLTCNEGYFIPDNSNSEICSKCSIENCKTCTVSPNNEEICLECKSTFTEKKNKNGTIDKCYCYLDFEFITLSDYTIIINDVCLLKGNLIEIEYNITNLSEKHKIMNSLYTEIELKDIDIIIDKSLIHLSQDLSSLEKAIYFYYNKIGLHKLIINIRKELTSMAYMFYNIHSIKSIKFLEDFSSSKVTSMEKMFSSTFIEYIDMKNLNTSNLTNLESFLEDSPYIKYLDISNFNTSKVNNTIAMFHSLNNLKELNLSSFDTNNVRKCFIMFHDFPENCTIIISNKFKRCLEQIPYSNKIINIDEIACKNFNNCEKCSGSVETLVCTKCKKGYQLINNICMIPKCTIGENEKCLSCNIDPEKENECSECNEGYYLPMNSTDKTKCSKCMMIGCEKCDDIQCIYCRQNYFTIINDTWNIVSCNLTCELGKDDKCLTCDTSKRFPMDPIIPKKCRSCNNGYKLLPNGHCQKIENSFIAIYKVIKNLTRIICINKSGIKISDFDMYINGKKVVDFIIEKEKTLNLEYVSYIFPSFGEYSVKIIFHKTLIYMKYLFAECYDLKKIYFNSSFDTSHVLSMRSMFYNCINLTEIDVSSFDTSLVGDMNRMFSGCNSLYSIHLSNFYITNAYDIQCMFDSPKLSYIDISSFSDINSIIEKSSFICTVAQKGEIFINSNLQWKKNVLPSHWMETIFIKNLYY